MESTDCLNYKLIDKTNLIIQELTKFNIKPTFATKLGHFSNINKLINVKVNTARIRMSVMPQQISSSLEIGSSKIIDRIEGIQVALEKGYEVHLNFSPVVVYKDWLKDYENLMVLINSNISNKAKSQLKCEVIFLTHEEELHLQNLETNMQGEKLLHTPSNQEIKINNRGTNVIRYNRFYKSLYINKFKELLEDIMPYCSIRYIF